MVSAKGRRNNQIGSDPMIHCAQGAKTRLGAGTGTIAFDISWPFVSSRRRQVGDEVVGHADNKKSAPKSINSPAKCELEHG